MASKLIVNNIESLDTGRVIEVDSLSDMKDLANDASGFGASLVSMEDGPTVEVAVLDRVIRVTSIAAMLDITPIDALQISVENYHSNYFGGGGIFSWDATKDKADHNGGTVIDPVIVFPTDWADQTERTVWFTAAATGTGCWVRKVDTAASIMWFGAVGDLVVDDRDSINECLKYCRNFNKALYIPAGNFLCLSPMDAGKFIEMFGDGTVSNLRPSFSSENYLFHITDTGGTGLKWSDFQVTGPEFYSPNTKFALIDEGYMIRFEDLVLVNLGGGIRLVTAWGTYVSRLFSLYVKSPLYFGKGNGSTVRDAYIIRYQGTGVSFKQSLCPRIENCIFEYGESGGYAVGLQATKSAVIEGLYTEGGEASAISMIWKNGKSCIDTKISNLWLDAGGAFSIDCHTYNGLEIDNVVMNTRNSGTLIDFNNTFGHAFSAGKVYVNNVCQIDQNANGFVGDLRETGDTLISISDENSRVVMIKPFAKYGDGTDADLTNIANHTVKDSSGTRPFLYSSPTIALGASPADLSNTTAIAAYNYGPDSDGIFVYSKDWGAATLHFTADVTADGDPYLGLILVNTTLSEEKLSVFSSIDTSIPLEGDIVFQVRPGINKLIMKSNKRYVSSNTSTIDVTSVNIT